MRSSSHAGAVLTVDLDALVGNYRLLRARSAPARCAAVVKADAYGLGVERVAPALARSGCDTFFVATLDEGIELRALVAAADIYVLNGLPPGSADTYAAHRLRPVLNQLGEIDSWRAFLGARRPTENPPLAAALHLDTGMNRLGLPPEDAAELANDPGRLEGIEIALVISHLACAEQPDHPLNGAQRALFDRLRAGLRPAPASLANSSGIFHGPAFHYDLVRPGAALYGINPTPAQDNPMAEVVRLQAKIAQVRAVDSPMTVGYGAAHRVTGKARIATVLVGYADGFMRAFSDRGFASVGGTRVPVVGRVSMDMISLDVSALPPDQARPGTVVDLIGGSLRLDAVARLGGTIGYEILTALGHRFRRVYRDGNAA